VTAQDPAKGSSVPKGSAIAFTVSKGQNTVVLPDESGNTFAEASADLVALGFTASRRNENSDTVPTGQVISQDPAAGTAAPKGSAVTLHVSIGQARVSVPNVVNKPEGDARAAINGAGLKVAKTEASDESIAAGSVISQDPGPGAKVDPGATVDIVVSTGPAVISVPDETGKATAEAQADLKKVGLLVHIAFVQVADPAQAGIVQAQDPAAGSSAKKGDVVTLQVGSQAAP
jgi:serine/threonine-protein kinase